jgi:hypothetical protein
MITSIFGENILAALLGALVGAFITYRFALHLTQKQFVYSQVLADKEAVRIACANFRSAFAPALAQIDLARNHGNHNPPCVGTFLKSALLAQAAAVEVFRPYVVSESALYQSAWEECRKEISKENHLIDSENWGEEGRPSFYKTEEKIHALLQFAKI